MTRLFVYTAPFRSCWKAMGLDDSDLLTLERILLENPQKGDVIEGTGGARKLRIRLNDNKGKSGGGRDYQTSSKTSEVPSSLSRRV